MRIRFIFILFLLGFIVIIIRLFFWQISSFDILAGLAERQTRSTLTIPARRGKIFTIDSSPLVINRSSYVLYVEPHKIKDVKKTSEILGSVLDLSVASISSQLVKTNLRYLPLASKLEEEKIAEIKKNNLTGVGFIEEGIRFYPEASMAAHLLGFVGKNSKGQDQGYFGIEGYYDEQLRGRDGYIKYEEDALGNPILTGNKEEIPALDGRDLYLTLDKTVQYIAETKLKTGIEKYAAKGGTVIVMDPQTGGILAMASFPSYDPNTYQKFSEEQFKNPAVSSSYEPGSTFKVLVMAAALNEGRVKGEDTFDESGPLEIGGYTIKTWNEKYHGMISVGQILEYSSNVGMVLIEKKLGHDNLIRYLEFLGFGNQTGIDLQEEAAFPLRAKNRWYEIDYATASFGQGIAVTPLQMIRAVAAIANGGKLVRPFVVKSIRLGSGETLDIRPKEEVRVYKKEITSLLTEMMVNAVDNGETRFIKPAGYRVAGKTGTAQIPIAGHYDTEKTIASFVGFAPVDNPKFVILVSVAEPTSSPWGSETAAPIFFEITKDLFSYYGISP